MSPLRGHTRKAGSGRVRKGAPERSGPEHFKERESVRLPLGIRGAARALRPLVIGGACFATGSLDAVVRQGCFVALTVSADKRRRLTGAEAGRLASLCLTQCSRAVCRHMPPSGAARQDSLPSYSRQAQPRRHRRRQRDAPWASCAAFLTWLHTQARFVPLNLKEVASPHAL